jgi:hypothetical protein
MSAAPCSGITLRFTLSLLNSPTAAGGSSAVATLSRGAAARGRPRRGERAQPCSFTLAPRRPFLAALGACGSEVLWPAPRRGRPAPWEPLCSHCIADVVMRVTTPAPLVMLMLMPSFVIYYQWPPTSHYAASSWGPRAAGPSPTLTGCCRYHHAADAPRSGAVGRGGLGQFGLRRWATAAAEAPRALWAPRSDLRS